MFIDSPNAGKSSYDPTSQKNWKVIYLKVMGALFWKIGMEHVHSLYDLGYEKDNDS
jgi:hypothetical protein